MYDDRAKVSEHPYDASQLAEALESHQQLFDSFTESWRRGNRPIIESYLSDASADERRLLLPSFVAIEIRQRRTLGEQPTLQEYFARFPDEVSLLESHLTVPLLTADSTCTLHSLSSRDEQVPLPLLEPGQTLGRYRIQRLLGRGGFGDVLLAVDPELDRKVAVKTIRLDRVPRTDAQSFLEEGRKLARLAHPNIVPVYDVGEDQGRHYIVSKYMKGGSLTKRLKHHRPTPQQAAALIAEIAEALHFAHCHNIVHRDVKPANILLDENGRPSLADFGVAISEWEQLREKGGTCGTYGYMSPEQLRGDSHLTDARTDVYSLGVTFYEMLTGRLPYVADSPTQYRQQVLCRPARPPRTIDATISRELERICLKCLEKDPARRYTTAADLASDLHQFVRPRRRWGRRAMAAAALILMSVAALSLITMGDWADGAPEPIVSQHQSEWLDWPERLGEEPSEVFWPGFKGMGAVSPDRSLQAVQVVSRFPRLIQLGELDRSSATLSVAVQHSDWMAGTGLYLGYRVEDRADGSSAVAQTVTLGVKSDTDGSRSLVVRRAIMEIFPDSGQAIPVVELGYEEVPWPQAYQFVRLEVQIKSDQLLVVRCDGRELKGLTGPYQNGRTSAADIRGPWGLFNSSQTAWFREPAIVKHVAGD